MKKFPVLSRLSAAALAIFVLQPTPAHADFWSKTKKELGNAGRDINREANKVYNKTVDNLHNVATLGGHGRERDAERARQAEAQSQQAREAAETLRQQKIKDLIELINKDIKHRDDLKLVVKKAGGVLTDQASIRIAIEQVYKSQLSAEHQAKVAQIQAKVGRTEMLTTMTVLKKMFASSASPVKDSESFKSFEFSVTMLAELADENGVTMAELLTAALAHQSEMGKDVGALVESVNQRSIEIRAFRDEMAVKLSEAETSLKTNRERLRGLDPSRVPAEN